MLYFEPEWNFKFALDKDGVPFVDDYLARLKKYNRPAYDEVLANIEEDTLYQPLKSLPHDVFKPISSGFNVYRITTTSLEVEVIGVVSYTGTTPTFFALCAYEKKGDYVPSVYMRKAQVRHAELFMGESRVWI